jgi:hypothetical protein
MKTLRFAVSAVALVLLAAGYAASQLAYFDQSEGPGVKAYEYALKVDQGPVVYGALGLLVLALVLAVVPHGAETEEQS